MTELMVDGAINEKEREREREEIRCDVRAKATSGRLANQRKDWLVDVQIKCFAR